ncbi:MAG: hypothetical protein SNJ77_11085 [Cytophagales bacterium]
MKKNIILYSTFVSIGLFGGYLYYQLVGCSSGTCAITSSPISSTLYGGLLGYMLAGVFMKQKKES